MAERSQFPNLWHWVEPNPRHAIEDLASGTALTNRAPDPRYGKYKTYADIDRTPWIFFRDLVTERPSFRHPLIGDFFSFGWCSEREMAFASLLVGTGHDVRLRQQGGHVWSEVWVSLPSRDGGTQAFVVTVDNTYARISARPAAAGERTEWQSLDGVRFHERWYNRTARDEAERAAVESLEVSPAAARRIRDLVANHPSFRPRPSAESDSEESPTPARTLSPAPVRDRPVGQAARSTATIAMSASRFGSSTISRPVAEST